MPVFKADLFDGENLVLRGVLIDMDESERGAVTNREGRITAPPEKTSDILKLLKAGTRLRLVAEDGRSGDVSLIKDLDSVGSGIVRVEFQMTGPFE